MNIIKFTMFCIGDIGDFGIDLSCFDDFMYSLFS